MSYSQVITLAERYDRQVGKVDAATAARMEAAIDQAYRELVDALDDGWDDIVANKSIIPQQQRLLIIDQLGDALAVIKPEMQAEYDRLLVDALKHGDELGGEYFDRVSAILQPDAAQRAALSATTGVPVEALTNQAVEGMRRLYRYGEEVSSQISAIVEQGLIQNWGVRKVAAAIEVTAGLVKARAIMIARTEINSAFNGATRARAIASGSWVQWISVGDSRTCKICVNRNMRTYKAQEIYMPAHPLCRCVMSPLWRDWLNDPGVLSDEDLEYSKKKVIRLRSQGRDDF
ncbi:MAG: hypothetical protein DCF32_09570, partial [Leptolyngbya sp.]